MSRTRLVLIGLAAAVIVALVAAWAVPVVGNLMSANRANGVIRIAIATDETIERMVSDSAPDEAEADASNKVGRFLNQSVGTATPAAAPAQTQSGDASTGGEGQTARETEFTFPSDVASAFSQILLLQLDGQLTQGLDSSNRFEVVDTNAVETALRQMTDTASGSGRRSLIETVLRMNTSGTSEQVTQRRASNADLASIGRELNADYFLYVGVEEPVYSIVVETDEMTGEEILMFKAQPTFVFRLFDTRGRTVRLAGVLRFSEPMISYSEHAALHDYLLAAPAQQPSAQGASAVQRLRDMPVMQDLAFQVNREVARQVIQRVLEDIAPAEIVEAGDAIVANRGANDGLVAGMEMEVFRLGDEIREDGGRTIGRQRSRVGVVRVADVQDTTASLAVVSDGPFRPRDRIAMPLVLTETMGDVAASEAATPAAPAQALGRDAILAERHGDPAAIRPAIAVDSINLTFDGEIQQAQTNTLRLNASRSLSDALQSDPRISVLPRADLQRLSRERRIAGQARGGAADPRRGLAVGEYFLTGEVIVDTNVSRPSVTYEGVSRATGPARTTRRMRGAYRVTTMDGRAVASIEVEETGAASNTGELLALIDRLSNEAARALLADLFPMQVASVDTGRQRVRVTGGSNSGLSVNTRLRVYNLGGEPVFDPVTRVMLSAGERNYAGDLIIIDVQPDISTARFAGQAFNVAVGDEVELAPAPRRAAAPSPAQPQTQATPETAGPTPF